MTSRKTPGVAFWAAVVVAVGLVAYPLSYGPVTWLFNNGIVPTPLKRPLANCYASCGWAYVEGPKPLRRAYRQYIDLWR